MLNYHHLRYFLAAAKSGTLARASADLKRTPQTLSHQIQALEEALGTQLFERRGRRLVLTDAGTQVVRYAEEIFSLGEDLVDAVEHQSRARPLRLTVGVADVLPKRVAHALIRPVFRLPRDVRIVCREASPERLLGDLAIQEVDLVLSDAPIPPFVSVRAQGRLLLETEVILMAAPALAETLRGSFPESLSGSPLLVPTERAAMRRQIDRWIDKHRVHPQVVGEFDDFALMGVFAQAGIGALAVPAVIAQEATLEFDVIPVATLDGVQVSFYALCLEQSVQRPAIRAILDGTPSEPHT
jgi:LysR family transcriptional activator of nhaA